jgi:hypothetical protein
MRIQALETPGGSSKTVRSTYTIGLAGDPLRKKVQRDKGTHNIAREDRSKLHSRP